MSEPEEWIAATGPRRLNGNSEDAAIPDVVLSDSGLALIAKGLYAVALSEQGQPIDPHDDAFEAVEEIRAAIAELVAAGLVVRMTAP